MKGAEKADPKDGYKASMVAPGHPMLNSIGEWKDKLIWPDIDSWCWNKQLELSKDLADMTPEKLSELAKQYVDEFFCPGAPAMVGFNSQIQNPFFFEEIYRYSRKKASR